MKTCSKCGVEKDETEYYVRKESGKLRNECKVCFCSETTRYSRAHPEASRAAKRKNAKKRRVEQADHVRAVNRKSRSAQRVRDPQKIRDYYNDRYATNLNFRLSAILRSQLTRVLRRAGVKKDASADKLLGCPLWHLMAHFDFLFKPGMTWENHGPVWHIDHIRPCASFDLRDPEQRRRCFHWTNLQPLFAEENLRKSHKYAPPEYQTRVVV